MAKVCRCAGGESLARLLANAAVDQHEDWRQECVALRGAYAGWCAAPAHERSGAYARFTLALDREKQASRIYRELLAEHSRASRRAPR
jgi:hypothetical protein